MKPNLEELILDSSRISELTPKEAMVFLTQCAGIQAPLMLKAMLRAPVPVEKVEVDTYLTLKELCAEYKVKEGTVYQWVHKSEIPYSKCGHLLRFNSSEVRKYFDSKRHKNN